MRKKYLSIALISFFIIAFFLLLNYLQPMRADDFGRANTDMLANGLIMMVHSIQVDYMTWTGRVSAQALIYLLMSKTYITLSLFIVNFVNSMAFYLFMLLSFKIVTLNKGKILSKDFIVFSFFFLFIFYQTGFIANVLWKTGAIQYFWGIVLLVGFYYFSIIRKKENILFGLFTGSIIGLYNEIFVCISILLCLAYFVEKITSKQKINNGVTAFFVSCAIGGAILILAPGNYARLAHLSSGAAIETSTLANVFNLVHQIIFQSQYTFILLVLMILSLFLVFSNRNVKKSKAVIYSVTLFLSLFILVPVAKSYDLNQRVLLIYYAIFFITFFQQFYNHSGELISKLSSILRKFSLLFMILLIAQMYLITSMSLYFYNYEQNRNKLVEYYHVHNISNPTLPCLTEYMGPTVFLDDITPDKNVYNNKAYAEFYGFESVSCKR